MENNKLKAIFFDAGNTLLYIHPSVGEVYADETRKLGVDVNQERFEKKLHDIWLDHSPVNQVEEGGDLKASDQKDRAMWKEFLRKIYEEFEGLHTLDFERWFQNIFQRFGEPRTFKLYSDSLDTITELKKRGKTVGIVSNWDSRLLQICEGLGIRERFDFVLPSAVAGYRKPSRKIFDQALEKAGVAPEHALHVGDKKLDDYRGASKAGLNPVLIDRDNNYNSDSHTVITSLSELPDLIESS